MKRLIISLVVAVLAIEVSVARERTNEELKNIAAAFFNSPVRFGRSRAKTVVSNLSIVRKDAATVIVKNGSVGFVVLAKDDSVTPVLGYSDSPFDKNCPPAFDWWLECANDALRSGKYVPDAVREVPSQFSEYVEPLLETKWDQGEPFNQKVPFGSIVPTGCSATAMAQIMKFHEYPQHGYGSNTYTTSAQHTELSMNFENTYFDWANMLNEYKDGQYSQVNVDAVSSFMFACGIAVNTQYNMSSTAYVDDVEKALRENFGYTTAIDLNFSESAGWKTAGRSVVFSNISRRLPVLFYGGNHMFVLDGYDMQGLFHVNWGWGGYCDGYFDLDALNPDYASYNSDRGMIVEIKKEPTFQSIHVTKAGSLLDEILKLNHPVEALKITGTLNEKDIEALRDMADNDHGHDNDNYSQDFSLDLSEAYVNNGDKMNELPDKAFDHAVKLKSIKLPKDLVSIGDYAFRHAGYYLRDDNLIDSIEIPSSVRHIGEYAFYESAIKKIKILGGVEVIGKHFFYGSRGESIELPNSVQRIEGDAFYASRVKSIKLQENPQRIERFAFRDCFNLNKIELPRNLKYIGLDAFYGTDLSSLDLPEGLDTMYFCFGNKGNTQLKYLKIPSTVRYASHGFPDSLETIVFAEGMEKLPTDGYNDLKNLKNLKNIVLPSTLKGYLSLYLPNLIKSVHIPEGVEKIGGISGDSLCEVVLPSTIQELGSYAFARCPITSITIMNPEPFTLSETTFTEDSYISATLYVPKGSRGKYWKTNGWKNFRKIVQVDFTNIKDIKIKADDKVRIYGEENPVFTYTTEGEEIDGEPELYCPATETSPAGTYPIYALRGNVKNIKDSYVDGTLTILPAPLTISTGDYTYKHGGLMPPFPIQYDGFKLGEDKTVLSQLPVVTCDAYSNSPIGCYPIVISGAKSENYDISYINGTLTIEEADAIKFISKEKTNIVNIYDLNGRQRKTLQKGINIIRLSNGTARKIMVK